MPTPARKKSVRLEAVRVRRVDKKETGEVSRVDFQIRDHQTGTVRFQEGGKTSISIGSLLHSNEDDSEPGVSETERAKMLRIAHAIYREEKERRERLAEKENAPHGWEGTPLGRVAENRRSVKELG